MIVNIVNGTPHDICIYDEVSCSLDSASRKLILAQKDATPLYRIPAGIPLNAKTRVREIEAEYPFLKGAVEFVDADPLPEGDIVIVSNLYRSALRELGLSTNRCATVGGTVYAGIDNPRPVGCLFLNLG